MIPNLVAPTHGGGNNTGAETASVHPSFALV